MLVAAALLSAATDPVAEKSIGEISADLAAQRSTSVALVEAYRARAAVIDRDGPMLRSIIVFNPRVLNDARRADADRAAGRKRGPLAGIPVLIKDNIETDDGTATTAGSLVLRQNVSWRDAPLVARLKDAGALILGKTNLSEWANIRSSYSISGWSAVGGLVRNPYVLDRSICGSSSGTAAAVAASLGAAGVGTETNGSVTCPAAMGGLVGLKPTVGLISRRGVVPISSSQDTPGPMARTVADAALLLTAMAGSDPGDAATAGADRHRTDYLAALGGATLKGKRLGVLRAASELQPATVMLFEATLARLRTAGAVLVEITDFEPDPALGKAETTILLTETKAGLDVYLAATPPAVRSRSLKDVIAFNAATPRETALFGQDFFIRAQATKGLDDPEYKQSLALARSLTREKGIDALLARHRVEALIAPSFDPAWRLDLVTGDHASGEIGNIAAIAGYPHLTVPMGLVRGLPVGLSFVGPAWSEVTLLRLGSAFEALVGKRPAPTYAASVESSAAMAATLQGARGDNHLRIRDRPNE